MTHRIYYTEPFTATFTATVASSVPVDGRAHVTLDTTAFYPTSGGQPFDTGTLGGRRVLDVVDGDDGVITHVVDGPLEPGHEVTGVVDWPRRFDHMQQHTGQHVLSAAFERTCAARTASFHLGTTTCTIDLAREVTPAEIASAEALASQVVCEDRPVQVRFASETEAAALPLRKEPARGGTLRLVDVKDFDLSACGGTHVSQTGQIGLIAVSGWERFKGGSRVAFVCGRRALVSHRHFRDVVTGLVRQLTVAQDELGPAVERMQAEARTHLKTIRQLREAAAEQDAAALISAGEDVGGFRRVLVTRTGWDVAALKTLATAIAARPGCVAVVAGDDTPVSLVVVRAADVAFDAGAWMKQITGVLGGRGGGRSESAQGGVTATLEQVLAFARDSVR
ncbi:MAG: alanyl-tRNA editing protein [Acidobacteria bacterium]|nr:alanyl-tRNA editing protein [Acidobacteriota bacterium]